MTAKQGSWMDELVFFVHGKMFGLPETFFGLASQMDTTSTTFVVRPRGGGDMGRFEFKQLKPFMDCPFPVVRKNILGALLNSKGFKTLPQEDKVYWLKYAIEHYEPEEKE
tara:strand:- start:392 stop:721 length:330 start_codon:yes stop_codon:yes gene_type:complete